MMVAMDIFASPNRTGLPAAAGPGLPFAKGHGTGNDFVIVPDPDGRLDLSAEAVAALCDRRRGLGADGLLRIVRTAALGLADADAQWFMDYRNADGSLAQMCGNGVRVYARYLVESGLVSGATVPILTRAGLVVAQVGEDIIAVDMPWPTVHGPASVRVSDVDYPGTVAVCGNPNLVCPVPDPAGLDLHAALRLDPVTFPNGANVEFFAFADQDMDQDADQGVDQGREPRVRMRVVERGVGETLSCGSGACAVAAVVLAGTDGTVVVEVPGGTLRVTLRDRRCVLAGPAVIIATGTVDARFTATLLPLATST
jgi:diaminopimelate epimerase